jgi:hypothetical protein
MNVATNNNRQRTIIIVVVIVVILLCCCCPAVSYGLYWLWNNGDRLLGITGQVLPLALTAL